LIDHLLTSGQRIHDFSDVYLRPLIMVNFDRVCHARALFFGSR
jgi:hypothetical protein